MLRPGDRAPEFRAPSLGPEGLVEESSTAYRGRPLIVVFFAQANAPACRSWLLSWRAAFGALKERGCALLAVSTDHVHAQRLFADAAFLRFPLLSDPGAELVDAFGVRDHACDEISRPAMARKIAFAIGADGSIRERWEDDPSGSGVDAGRVLSVLGEA